MEPKSFEEIKKEAKEYAREIDNAFRDLSTAMSLSDGFSRGVSGSVNEIRGIFDRMDRDNRIPSYVTDFYRKIYATIIEDERP